MNASGKRISRAPLPEASTASSAMRSMVAARSNSTGSTWTQATVIGSFTPPIVAVSAPYAQDRAHAELRVVRDRAPEAVAARPQPHRHARAVARARHRKARQVPAADPPHTQVVRILAVVLELDHDDARFHRSAGEHQPELASADAETRRSGRGRLWDERSRGRCGEDQELHFSRTGRWNELAPGMTAVASAPSHCSTREL